MAAEAASCGGRGRRAREAGEAIVIGVAGGSGSGKTTLAEAVFGELGREEGVAYVCHDSYFKDLSHLPLEERALNNFDHPDSLDTPLLVEHIQQLRRGEEVAIPTYSFSVHTRLAATRKITPRKVILLEGILIFNDPALRNEIDIRVFVDTPADIRFIRRLRRDIAERGRDMDSVLTQYLSTVRPMHNLFCEPSKVHSDVIVPDGINPVVLGMIVAEARGVQQQGGGTQSDTQAVRPKETQRDPW